MRNRASHRSRGSRLRKVLVKPLSPERLNKKLQTHNKLVAGLKNNQSISLAQLDEVLARLNQFGAQNLIGYFISVFSALCAMEEPRFNTPFTRQNIPKVTLRDYLVRLWEYGVDPELSDEDAYAKLKCFLCLCIYYDRYSVAINAFDLVNKQGGYDPSLWDIHNVLGSAFALAYSMWFQLGHEDDTYNTLARITGMVDKLSHRPAEKLESFIVTFLYIINCNTFIYRDELYKYADAVLQNMISKLRPRPSRRVSQQPIMPSTYSSQPVRQPSHGSPSGAQLFPVVDELKMTSAKRHKDHRSQQNQTKATATAPMDISP